MGENEASALLEKTLEEEKETDKKLTELSDHISVQAKEQSREEQEEEESGNGASRSRARGARA